MVVVDVEIQQMPAETPRTRAAPAATCAQTGRSRVPASARASFARERSRDGRREASRQPGCARRMDAAKLRRRPLTAAADARPADRPARSGSARRWRCAPRNVTRWAGIDLAVEVRRQRFVAIGGVAAKNVSHGV